MSESRLDAGQLPLTVIRPSRGWVWINLGELWRYRELVLFLTWRDVMVRYKQTLLGAAWAILQPFLTMVVFSVFFGELAGIDSGGLPYPIFSYSALLPWLFFENGLNKAGNSLVAGRNLITKVYFPRLAVPLGPLLAGFVDFALAFVVLLGMLVYYGIRPTSAVWTLPLFLLLTFITALGASLWFSALNVTYRDIGYILPFISRAWFFLTPITYDIGIVPEAYRTVYALNPMVGVIEGFRWAMLGSSDPPNAMLAASTLVALVMLISGAAYFRRMERTFADVV